MTDGHACCVARRDSESARQQSDVPSRAKPVRHAWSDILAGSFRIGSDRLSKFAADGEGPSRLVELSPFRIARYAVTNGQFGAFVRETGYTTDAERYDWSFVFDGHLSREQRTLHPRRPADAPWWVPLPHAYWAQPEGPGSTVLDRMRHPVVHVSWDDTQAYCRWSGTALPSEAQWEAAARGGLDGALYPWGDDLRPDGKHRCNIWQGAFPSCDLAEDGFAGTCPVDAFAPNGLGVFNAVGNVWEWCEDAFSPHYHSTTSSTDPLLRSDEADRALRGGSYLCHASYCDRYRVAARTGNTRSSSAGNIGFRVVERRSRSATA